MHRRDHYKLAYIGHGPRIASVHNRHQPDNFIFPVLIFHYSPSSKPVVDSLTCVVLEYKEPIRTWRE